MGKDATFFATPTDLRAWLEEHHATETELWLGYYKKAAGRETITWAQAVEEALCFGWIDGKVQRIDELRYRQRLTPRRRDSNWSAVNIAKIAELREQGRMTPAGEAAFAGRREDRTAVYTYERTARGRVRRGAGDDVSRQQEGVGLVRRAVAVVQAAHDLLGRERQAAGHASQTARNADRMLRRGTAGSGADELRIASGGLKTPSPADPRGS